MNGTRNKDMTPMAYWSWEQLFDGSAGWRAFDVGIFRALTQLPQWHLRHIPPAPSERRLRPRHFSCPTAIGRPCRSTFVSKVRKKQLKNLNKPVAKRRDMNFSITFSYAEDTGALLGVVLDRRLWAGATERAPRQQESFRVYFLSCLHRTILVLPFHLGSL